MNNHDHGISSSAEPVMCPGCEGLPANSNNPCAVCGKKAPEAEPVARVTGYYAGYLSIATIDGRVLPTGTALYLAPPAPSVPDGWKLVPVEPTPEMMRSGMNVPFNKAARHNAVYRAMLKEAPQPPKLSDERIREIWVEHGQDDEDVEGFARAIEREILGGEYE